MLHDLLVLVCVSAMVTVTHTGERCSLLNSQRTTPYVAFSVGLAAEFTAPSSPDYSVIPMDTVFYNGGGHYNMADNSFIVPYDGVYAFSYRGCSNDAKIVLFAGNPPFSRTRVATAGGDTGNVGMYELLDLNRGDKVQLKMYAGGSLKFVSVPSTMFTGELRYVV